MRRPEDKADNYYTTTRTVMQEKRSCLYAVGRLARVPREKDSSVTLDSVSSGRRMYLIVLPRMKASFILWNVSPSLLVQMTSRMWMFIHVSHCTIVPLYVSPFFSSINWTGTRAEISTLTLFGARLCCRYACCLRDVAPLYLT